MLVHKEFPEDVAVILNSLSAQELKKRIITANGLTLAQEEEILNMKSEDFSKSMTSDEYLAELRGKVKPDNGD